MENLTVLQGHTSQDTAYLVEDYPYGFRLRCKIRYWLEYRMGYGFRLMSQTSNPKVSYAMWNKPKGSTYNMLAVMGLDDKGHVTWTGVSMYYPEKLAEFEAVYGASFDDNQLRVCRAMQAHERNRARRELAV